MTTPIPPRPFTAKLAEKQILNDKFQLLRFEVVAPHDFAFVAGQYLLLNVPGTPQKKSYSIASSPSVGHGFDLLIDITPQGLGTKYLSTLNDGEAISGLAPLGQFIISNSNEQALVFIATGSGVAPIKSMLDELLIYSNDARPMILYWGLRYPQDQFWYDEFAQLAEQHPNFVFHPVLSKPTADWTLCRGHVTDCLTVHALPNEAGYYLCGSQAMIIETVDLLQRAYSS
jgi:NAD(P)H-flavin reductase